jgi:hypothetical protein
VADDGQAVGLLASSGGLAGLDPMAAAVRRPPSASSAGGPLASNGAAHLHMDAVQGDD